ncbi:MAG: hypothetical protein UHD09_00360, partial [Bifidobacterium sp.]|nr:hypothetical protein [Bifidobacterium sp.]
APGDADGEAVPVEMVSRAAVVSMESALPNAPELMRATIVAIDGIPGTQVEGISPLYHVMDPDGGSANSAVLALRTTMSLGQLSNMLQAMHETHEGAVKLAVVDMERPAPRDRERLGEAHRAAARAAVLSPWMDMDPNATLDGDPLAFLLASAPDAPFVGMQSDNWIIGGAR